MFTYNQDRNGIGMRATRNMKWLKIRTFFVGGMLGIPFGILFNLIADVFRGIVTNFQNLMISGITFFLLFFLIALYTNKRSYEIDETA
jgi:hypothetical protein